MSTLLSHWPKSTGNIICDKTKQKSHQKCSKMNYLRLGTSTLYYIKNYLCVHLCIKIISTRLNIIHLLHGFEGEIPAFLSRCHRKTLECYAKGRGRHNIPGHSCNSDIVAEKTSNICYMYVAFKKIKISFKTY